MMNEILSNETLQDRNFSILVTDDDAGTRRTVAQMLRDQGFSTHEANCGEEAIEIVRVEVIHLACFDMHMPGMTGLEAYQQIRFIQHVLPAILLTANATREVMQEALEAEVFSVIAKPINKRIFFHTLKRALEAWTTKPEPPEAKAS